MLAKNLARSIRRGHPWIFRDALRTPPALADGAPVTVTAPDGQPLARGFWDARSTIAVRVLEVAARRRARGGTRHVVETRVAAVDRPAARVHRPRTTTDAFRLIHGEADRLPGVHADLYGEAISIRFDGGGARAFYLDAGRPARACWSRPRGSAESP